MKNTLPSLLLVGLAAALSLVVIERWPTLAAEPSPSLSLVGRGVAAAERGQGSGATPRVAKRAVAETHASSSNTSAQELVASCAGELEKHQSVSAKLRQQIDLFGHQLLGSGTYVQEGRGANRRLRWSLEISVADQVSSVQQLCDGKHLWIHQELLGKTTLSRIDVSRVRLALDEHPPAAVGARPPQGFPLGGLPRLLQSLEASFHFTSASESQLDRVPVWTIEGRWTSEKLAELLPDQKEKILAGKGADVGQLPEQIPDRVILMVGRDDLFPYRIEYWRHSAGDAKTPVEQADKLLVVMELFEVQFGAPIDDRQFVYKPGDLEYADQTDAYLKSLGLADGAGGE